jgi:uncharacterized protein (DUF779 family)
MGNTRAANTSGDRSALLGVVYTAVLYSTAQQRASYQYRKWILVVIDLRYCFSCRNSIIALYFIRKGLELVICRYQDVLL